MFFDISMFVPCIIFMIHIGIFFCIIHCSLKQEDIYREAARPNFISRPHKAHDRRNPEDNMNFYNFQKNESLDQKPSEYDRYMAITQLINAALMNENEDRMDNLKEIDDVQNEIREMEKENQQVTNPCDLEQQPLNLVYWLSHDDSEEKELDQELSQEVEQNMTRDTRAEQHQLSNKEKRYLDQRHNERNTGNKTLQTLRTKYNVE